ncbi:MAG: LytTR family transcriptional regulator DNA-binding domain-containing protein [Bernardetiaceae bacterium]|nr:LytTR family transcriptional regulator DNA-binding domain-containing protein [Bernardetiaceae bacterium]
MKILAVEDEKLFAFTIEQIVEELGYELIDVVDSAEDMLLTFATTKPDLVLIDINIKGSMDGIEVARRISDSQFAVPIIFITSFDDKATFLRAREVKPFAYIVKPFDEKMLQRTIEIALYRYAGEASMQEDNVAWKQDLMVRNSFFIKVGNRLKKVRIDDIAYIESDDKYIKIYTDNDRFIVRMSLKAVLEKLPVTDFIRVHRSYVVNAKYIDSIDTKEQLIMLKEHTIPISKGYTDTLLKRLNTL